MPRKKLLILIIICIVIIISAIISVPLIIDSQKTATLNLFVVPEQSKILINGEEYKNGNYKFSPGKIEVSISKDGFETQTFVTELKSNETTLIYKLLNCSDSTLFCYLSEENESNFNLIPYIAHYSNDETATLDFYRRSSIKNILPIHYSLHNDDYSEYYIFDIQFELAENKIIININDMLNNGKELAYKIIQESGYDPSQYIINYKYTNIEGRAK